MDNVNLKKIINIKDKIDESIATQKPLIFTYTKRDEYIPKERRVVFQEIYTRNGHFYATGYCLKRKDKRTFRLDRIKEIKGLSSSSIKVPQTYTKSKTYSYPESHAQINRFVKTENSNINVEYNKFSPKEKIGSLLRLIGILIAVGGFIFLYIVNNNPGMWDKVFGNKKDYYATHSPVIYTKEKGYNKNYKQIEVIDINKKYLGYTIINQESYYRIKEFKKRYASLYDVIIKVNTIVFTKTTGIKDKKLLDIYINADLNKNAFLSWEEIKGFQMEINREFKYLENDTALRPDEFLKAGGGDCEDWALFTAGLLQFWNYTTYIGSLNFKDDYHAITLVRVNELPYRFKGYKITSAKLEGGDTLPTGIYTFIDYYKVGRLTRAGGRRPRLIDVKNPEWCYGRKM